MTPPLGAFVSSGLGGFRSSGLGAWRGADDAVEVLGHIRVDLIHGRAGTRLWYDKGLLEIDNYAPIGSADGRLILRLTLADLYYWTDPLTDDNKQVLLDGMLLGPDAYFLNSIRYPDSFGRVTRVSSRIVEIDCSPQVHRPLGFESPLVINTRDNTCGVRFTSTTGAGNELVYNVDDDSLESRIFDAGVFNTNHRIGYGGTSLMSVPGTQGGLSGISTFQNTYVEDSFHSGVFGYGGVFTIGASLPLPTPYQIDDGYPRTDWMLSGQAGDMCHIYTSTFNPRSGLTLVASFPISDLHPCRTYYDGEQFNVNFWPISGGMMAAVDWPKDDDLGGEARDFFVQGARQIHIKFLGTAPDPQLRCHLEFSRAGT